MPPEAVQCITGSGADVGDPLVGDKRVRKISFTGSLEVGKFADFIVIDRDFLDTKAVPDDKIGDIKVLMTVISGAVVWTHDDAPEALKKLPHVYGREYKLHRKAKYALGSTE